MSYTKKSFNQCIFNPMTEGRMLEEYPKLCNIILQEWTQDANLDSILRYVIMMFDPGSPLIKDETDLNFRKGVAAELSGLPEMIQQDVFMHTHSYTTDLIIKFLIRFARSKDFAALCAVEFCFWEGVSKLMTPISAEGSKEELDSVQKKAKLKDELDTDIKRLDAYHKSFFGDDDVLEKKAKRRGFTPEAIGIND